MPLADQTLRCHCSIGSDLLSNSRDVGWTSLLIDNHRVEPDDRTFETLATPDQTIVVMLKGEQEIEAFKGGLWRPASYRSGTVGLTPGGHVDRLRRNVGPRARAFEKANLYIPARTFTEVTEHYRRAGQRSSPSPLNALAFADPLLYQAAKALLAAMAAGEPDLYAEATGIWLATHLMSAHAGRFAMDESERDPGLITDRRLNRVLEFMSAQLARPLTLDGLAAEAGVSKFHFARLFRAKIGQTPLGFLADLRLDAARTLLAATDLDIATIAGRCGYARASHLSAAFVRRHGVPPTRWRAIRRGRSEDHTQDC